MPTARSHQGADFAHDVLPNQRFPQSGRFIPASPLTSAVRGGRIEMMPPRNELGTASRR